MGWWLSSVKYLQNSYTNLTFNFKRLIDLGTKQNLTNLPDLELESVTITTQNEPQTGLNPEKLKNSMLVTAFLGRLNDQTKLTQQESNNKSKILILLNLLSLNRHRSNAWKKIQRQRKS
jgi:hypothetical protein